MSSWIDIDTKEPSIAGRYLVVISGPSYEYVDIAYFNGAYFDLASSQDCVTKYQELPKI